MSTLFMFFIYPSERNWGRNTTSSHGYEAAIKPSSFLWRTFAGNTKHHSCWQFFIQKFYVDLVNLCMFILCGIMNTLYKLQFLINKHTSEACLPCCWHSAFLTWNNKHQIPRVNRAGPSQKWLQTLDFLERTLCVQSFKLLLWSQLCGSITVFLNKYNYIIKFTFRYYTTLTIMCV